MAAPASTTRYVSSTSSLPVVCHTNRHSCRPPLKSVHWPANYRSLRLTASASPNNDKEAVVEDKCNCESQEDSSSANDLGNNVSNSMESRDSAKGVTFQESPTNITNRIIAVASATAAVVLFMVTRGGVGGVTLGDLAATALPYEEALANGRPTVVEFYADWCEVCREMAPEVYNVEQQYKDRVNFVMLNVDNSKWEQELDEFGVEGIPHFAFLDNKGNEEGNIVGKIPRKYFEENVIALSKGDPRIPHSRVVGQFSNVDSRQAPTVVQPRSHGV